MSGLDFLGWYLLIGFLIALFEVARLKLRGQLYLVLISSTAMPQWLKLTIVTATWTTLWPVFLLR